MPERIAEAVRFISDVMLWSEVSRRLGMAQREVTDTMTLIVQRRNKIAHEADIMPDYAGQVAYSDLRSPIDKNMVDDAITFIEQVAEAIYDLVTPEQSVAANESGTSRSRAGRAVSS